MNTVCPNCRAGLDCPDTPGALAKCPACGKPFRLPAPSAPPPDEPEAPWKDNGNGWMVPAIGLGACVVLSAIEHPLAMPAFAVLGVGLSIWALGIVRAIAHRLRHVEQLLAERK